MISKLWFRRAATLVAMTALLSGVAPGALVSDSTAHAQAVDCSGANDPFAPERLGSGGEFHPVTPSRIFDSRTGVGTPVGRKLTSTSLADQSRAFDVALLGRGGIPAVSDDVLAVVVNVTVIGPSGPGYLSVYPKGFDTAGGSNVSSLINFPFQGIVPNMAILGPGTDGAITMQVVTPGGNGSADVIVDVFGWVSKSSYVDATDSGSRLVSVNPTRILDTRNSGAVGPLSSTPVQIRGVANGLVPSDASVTGAVVNLTVVNNIPASAPTFVSATPERTLAPTTSNTNVPQGRIKASLAIVPVGSDGRIHLFNESGSTHLLVDVLGYLKSGEPATSRTGRIVPLEAPFRAFDTRRPEFNSVPLGTGSFEDWSFADFASSVTINGCSVGAQSSMLGNLTATGLAQLPGYSGVAESFLTVYPGGTTLPNISNVNMIQAEDVPNMSLLKFGSNGQGDNYIVRAYNEYGNLHYLLDVFAIVLA